MKKIFCILVLMSLSFNSYANLTTEEFVRDGLYDMLSEEYDYVTLECTHYQNLSSTISSYNCYGESINNAEVCDIKIQAKFVELPVGQDIQLIGDPELTSCGPL